MRYITRKIEAEIIKYLASDSPRGIILAGIIGVGKTTLIRKIIADLKDSYTCFSFSGDDLKFRQAVAEDTRYLLQTIRSRTTEKSLVFIDEIQKTPEILDAVKLAYDEERISFIVTGSEPQYLLNQARQRLQRRARAMHLYPFSLNEIYSEQGLCEWVNVPVWTEILNGAPLDALLKIKGDWQQIAQDFNKFRPLGTIPLVYQEATRDEKLIAIANIINRGYRPIAGLTQREAETILTELTRLNNREFTYQTILNKTRLKRREKINAVIEFYTQNGLLMQRSRKIFSEHKQSYHTIYSFIDPGLVYYICPPANNSGTDNGFDLESIVHAQINNWQNYYALPFSVSYYTPYYIIPSGQLKYQNGSLDFLIESRDALIPIEVKSTGNVNHIDVPVMVSLIQSGRVPYGIVFYQGAPWFDKRENIYYLPLALL